MKQWTFSSAAAAVAVAVTLSASAQTTVNELLFNSDGTLSDQYPRTTTAIASPVTVVSGFGASTTSPYLSGLGTLQYTVTGAGSHYFDAMIDDDADLANGFTHDSASAINTTSLPSYFSWEIGNPTSGPLKGDTESNSLGNANDVPSQTTDIAVGLGFNFNLAAGQTATIDITASSTAPNSGFYIEQNNTYDDPYIYGTLSITSGGNTVPDGGPTWLFVLLGLSGLVGFKKVESKFFQKNV